MYGRAALSLSVFLSALASMFQLKPICLRKFCVFVKSLSVSSIYPVPPYRVTVVELGLQLMPVLLGDQGPPVKTIVKSVCSNSS